MSQTQAKLTEPKSRICYLNQRSPTRRALSLFADKWTVLAIYALKYESQRLGVLERTIEGITQKMLVETLRKMETNGLVTRTVFPVLPPHVEYTLTARGRSLLPILYSLDDWANDHLSPV